jgi:hypothetical protein
MNFFTVFSLKTNEVPLSLGPQPLVFTWLFNYESPVAGSAHNKSHSKPFSGTIVGLEILFIYYKFFKSGDIPPCIQSILSSIKAVTGKILNIFINSLQSFIEYLFLHSS